MDFVIFGLAVKLFFFYVAFLTTTQKKGIKVFIICSALISVSADIEGYLIGISNKISGEPYLYILNICKV